MNVFYVNFMQSNGFRQLSGLLLSVILKRLHALNDNCFIKMERQFKRTRKRHSGCLILKSFEPNEFLVRWTKTTIDDDYSEKNHEKYEFKTLKQQFLIWMENPLKLFKKLILFVYVNLSLPFIFLISVFVHWYIAIQFQKKS